MSDLATSLSISPELNRDMGRWQTRFLLVGILALAVAGIGAFAEPGQFLQSYLWSYMFYIGLTVGCLAVGMLQYLTGGVWGVVVRRLCESASSAFPLMALLFLPIAFGIPELYRWSHADVMAADKVLSQKSVYLNVPFFLIRAAIYLGGWTLCAYLLRKWSREHDQTGDRSLLRRLRMLSGPGLVFYGFSVTFMAIDWIMSVQPHWFSTMFGMLFIAGQGLSAFAFLIAVIVILSSRPPFSEIITPKHLHDLGKLLLAFVMVWAYFSFSQFLIIWSGNLTDEIPWYIERFHGGWQFIALGLVFLHFTLPFALLLSRELKRNFRLLTSIAILILVMRFVDLYWLVTPDFRKGLFGASWMDFVIPIGLGGIWLAFFTWQLKKRPLLPLRDPLLEEALAHGRH